MERALSYRTTLVALVAAAAGASCLYTSLGESALSPQLALAGLSALAGLVALSLARPSDREAWATAEGSYVGTATWLARVRPGVPVWVVRAVVVLTAPLAGFGVAAYALMTAFKTATTAPSRGTAIHPLYVIGTGLMGVSVVLTAEAAGLTLGDPRTLWSVLTIGAGLPLVWAGVDTSVAVPSRCARLEARSPAIAGYLMICASVIQIVPDRPLPPGVSPMLFPLLCLSALMALLLGPRWFRTSRLLALLRSERERIRERAEMADYLHDSVLQTLALIQRRSDDSAAVSTLARRQERELRAWLLGDKPHNGSAGLAVSLDGVVAEIEDAHGVRIELVMVGDAPLEDRVGALVGAAREALTNAARHAQGAPISVFARVDDGHIAVFVHDRGPGFDPDVIPEGRHGIKGSIIARMQRCGGRAEVRSAPGAGCEITLRLDMK